MRGRPASPNTQVLVEALRVLAGEGINMYAAARNLGVRYSSVFTLDRRHGIGFVRARPATHYDAALREGIKAGYAARLRPKEIADRLGHSESVVKVLACRMGLTKGRRADPFRYKRGYELPDHLIAQYRQLRLLGLTFEECGYELGLIERPVPQRVAA